MGVSGDSPAGGSNGATVGVAEGLAASGVRVATAVVGVAVLSADNPARGSLVWRRPDRG